MISELLAAIFLLAGCLFMLVAALGVFRMPDLLTRMHATTKSGVLGAGLIMCAVMLFFGESSVTLKALAVMAFTTLTSPIAAHTIGRAGYFIGVPLWEKTLKDELQGRYDEQSHTLRSQEASDTEQKS
ncbi:MULTISPECIES: monovalent cation/H(+) antiporter subunit G [Alishewanella]|jgi:multicomponent Na+:H+ antiporter subunit G|uniref:Monovalent cation/proton antiporter, MnhG/PhaG subunit n=1 Tax=Alishewanella jeotgali KCTC 22429 TaxID=1129374 RepID=H3ZD55_9ALTE|nr:MULTISPECIES: monovalent cation/H(+) antiporter subunit G [Alishewanella]EHR41488.1 monovalent cation/proton antiporter, MnhG/PhaG subunit [Alishewanella jeotgali KCTC 22429]